MSNCGFIDLNTFIDIQEKFADYLYLGLPKYKVNSSTVTKAINSFIKEDLANYVRNNFNRELTLEELDYASNAITNVSQVARALLNKGVVVAENNELAIAISERMYVNPEQHFRSLKPEDHILNIAVRKAITQLEVAEIPKVSNKAISKEAGAVPLIGINAVTGEIELVTNPIFEASQRIHSSAKINSLGDIDNFFRGAHTAKSKLEATLNYNLMRKYLINYEDGTYNTTGSEIDASIKNYKKDIYSQLVNYIKKQHSSYADLNDELYTLNVNNNLMELNPELPDILQRISDYYDSLKLTGKDLQIWAKDTDETDITNYLNFVMLSNFDNLLSLSANKIIAISDSTINSELETLEQPKYRLDIQSSIGGNGFNADEVYPLIGEQTSLYKRLIGSLAIVNSKGKISLTNQKDLSTINATVARLFQDVRDYSTTIKYSKNDPVHSMKAVFEHFIENHFKKGINEFKKERPYSSGEAEVVLSLYLAFFNNNTENLKNILSDSLYKTLTTSSDQYDGKTPLEYLGPSFYQLSVNTNAIKTNYPVNYTNVIVSNFNKTYFNNYSEITYDSTNKGLMVNLLNNKVYEGDVIWLKSSINSFVNNFRTLEQFQKETANMDINLNSGIVTFFLANEIQVRVDITKTGNTAVTVLKNGIATNDIQEELLTDNNGTTNSFIKMVEDTLGISLKDNTLSALHSELDAEGTYVNTLTTLARLTAAGVIIKSITAKPKVEREALIKSKTFLQRVGDKDTLYDKYYNEYVLNSLHATLDDDLTTMARAFSNINGAMYKPVTKVATGKNMPLHAEVRHLYVIQDLIEDLNLANAESENYPIENNLFVKNRSLLRSPVIRTFVKQGDATKASSDFTPVELTTAAIAYEYFGAFNKALDTDNVSGKVFIQPTVFTDKSMHYSLMIDMNKVVTVLGVMGEEDIALKNANPQILTDAMFYGGQDYYNKLAARMIKPYVAALQTYFETSPNSKLNSIAKKISNGEYDVNEVFQAVDKIMSTVPEALFRAAFYKTHGSNYHIPEELGFRKIKVDKITYLGLSESMLGFVKMYNDKDSFVDYMQKVRTLFANDLNNMNLKLEYFNTNGIVTPSFRNVFATMGSMLPTGTTEENFVKEWVAPTGYLINSKEINGKTVLNPLLENFFLMDSFISDNYQQVSMGTIHNHPTKGDIHPAHDHFMQVVSLKTKAGFKRQLGGTPGKPLNKGIIDGSTSFVKVVSMTDVEKETYNSFGIQDKMTTTDGAILTPMLQIIMQNNSFQDNAVGVNQKTLNNTLDPYYIGLDQDKCAEFGMTNEFTRRSIGNEHDLKILYRKAYNISFNDTLGGKQHLVNILRDYTGKAITIADIAPNGLYYAKWNILTGKNDVIQVTDITNDTPSSSIFSNNSTYIVTEKNLTEGSDPEPRSVEITSMYHLWEALGAEESVSLDDEGGIEAGLQTFVYSDASHYALAEFANRVGAWTTKSNLDTLGVSKEFMTLKGKNIIDDSMGRMATQNEVWQPLKESFIGKFVFNSAEKSGGMSLQNKSVVFADNDDPVIYSHQNVLSTLLLLNSDHHAEDAELTEMSQIVSALIFNSETYDIARDAYKAIGRTVNIKLQKFIKGIEAFKGGNPDVIYNEVVQFLIKQFRANNQRSIATLLASMAESVRTETPQNDGALSPSAVMSSASSDMPLSAYIYDSFIAMLTSSINKTAIKRKQSGLASVMKISAGFVQIHDVLNADGSTSTVTSEVFRKKHGGLLQSVPTNSNTLSMTQWYQIEGQQPILLDTPSKFKQFKANAKIAEAAGLSISKVYGLQRELKPLEVKFSIPSLGIENHSIYETEEFDLVSGVMDIVDRGKETTVDAISILTDKAKKQRLLGILKPYFPKLTAKELTVDFYKKNKLAVAQIMKNEIQKVFRQIAKDGTVTIGGTAHVVTDVDVIPGEAIGPNIFRKKFGLPKGVSISEITPKYFEDLLNKKSQPLTDKSTFYVRNLNGEHTYIFNEEDYAANRHLFTSAERDITLIDGERWLVDEFGDKEFYVGNTNFQRFTLENGKRVNAIILPDVSLEEGETEEQADDRYFLPVTEFIGENATGNEGKWDNLIVKNNQESIAIMTAKDGEMAQKIYSSFVISTEFIAARIPGQGPQSFTALRLVDFMNEENTIMTNHFTTWLKGEDYDIDKGFWLGVNINKNGLLTKWSKSFDYSSPEALRLSLKLPLPDGTYKTQSEEPGLLLLTLEDQAILINKTLTPRKVELLNKLSNVKSYNLEGIGDEIPEVFNLNLNVIDVINSYFSEVLNDKFLEKATKNKVSRTMYDMITHILNQVHGESPISFGEAKSFIKGMAPKIMSPNNFSTKAITQDANSVGKKVIGIAAVGLKVWSGLSFWGNTKLIGKHFEDLFIGKEYIINGKKHSIASVANLNFNNGTSFQEFVYQVGNLLEKQAVEMGDRSINIPEFLKNITVNYDLNIDQSLAISAILSAATDNAKELILQEINAGPDMARIFMYLSMVGTPFADIASMMNSPEIKSITATSKRNIFDKTTEFNKVEFALEFWKKGPELFRTNTNSVKVATLENYWKTLLKNKKLFPNGWNTEQAVVFKKKFSLTIPNLVRLYEAGGLKGDAVLAQIEHTLNVLKSNLPGSVAPFQGDYQGDLDYDNSEADEISEETGTVSLKQDAARFIELLEEYYYGSSKGKTKEEIESNKGTFDGSFKNRTAVINESVKNFEKIYGDSSEISLLGGTFSINQGIKTSSYGQYAFFKAVDSAIFKRIQEGVDPENKDFDFQLSVDLAIKDIAAKFNISLEAAGEKYFSVINKFSFKTYLSKSAAGDEDYKATAKIIMARLKKVFNLVDIVESIPHFREMLNAAVIMEDIKQAIAVKARSIDKMIQDVQTTGILLTEQVDINMPGKFTKQIEFYPTLKEDSYRKVYDFCNDVLIVRWFRSLEENKRTMRMILHEESVYNEDNQLTTVEHPDGKEVTIDLGTLEGRANFIIAFKEIISKLKQDPNYEDNSIIRNLGTDKAEDRLTGNKFKFFRLPINFMNITDHNKYEFDSYVTDFNELTAKQAAGHTIKDLFFIYNLLVHRDRANKSSFTKLFENDNDTSGQSLMTDYIQGVAKLDKEGVTLKSILEAGPEGDYDIVDIITKALANRTYPSKLHINKGSYAYTISANEKNEYKTTYYKWDAALKRYKPITHFADAIVIPLSTNSPISLQRVNLAKDAQMNLLNTILGTLAVDKYQINC